MYVNKFIIPYLFIEQKSRKTVEFNIILEPVQPYYINLISVTYKTDVIIPCQNKD